jgi:hypothetical protein
VEGSRLIGEDLLTLDPSGYGDGDRRILGRGIADLTQLLENR